MIKPSHYDDDGYVIQFFRSAMPSNTLATLYGLAADCRRRNVLGDDVEIRLSALDETNKRVKVSKFVRQIRRDGGLGLVALVGVQSNQFPRAMNLARQFRAEDIEVCIGGFHVSGCLSMISGLTPELKEALDQGVSLFAGEAENRLETVLKHAYTGELRPLYNYMADLPSIQDVPIPILDAKTLKRTGGAQSSFDAGRGCPFMCSFCTIINVQGRKSRYRSADDVEHIVRENLKQGTRRFFITDDNFARNQNWEAIFDRIIELRGELNASINLVLQVDTMCHRIPNFIEKAALAGTKRVFIGLESINPESLKTAQKGQNRITEYRQLLLAWRGAGVITTAGYILGFPNDTPDSIVRDVEIIKRELPIDILEFFFLTPLPGSADHKLLHENRVPMDPDLNKYDLNHVTTGHDSMSKEQWEKAYRLAWNTFFSEDHIAALLRRARASDLSLGKILSTITWFYGSAMYEHVHPLESGFIRYKFRKDRRPEFPIEPPWQFYPKYVAELVYKTWNILALYLKYAPLRRELDLDGDAVDYIDTSLEPVSVESDDDLEIFKVNQAAQSALARAKRRAKSPQCRPNTAIEFDFEDNVLDPNMIGAENHGSKSDNTGDDSTSSSAVLFEEGTTMVTHAVLRHSAQSWPVSSIVKVTDFKKPLGMVSTLANGTGVLFALFAFFQFTLIWVAAGVAIGALCGFKIYDALKLHFIVCVKFVSGEEEKIYTTDRGIAIRLRKAIRAAMGSS